MVTKNHLHQLLQPISSEQPFLCDMLQIDVVESIETAIYKYALSGGNFFSN